VAAVFFTEDIQDKPVGPAVVFLTPPEPDKERSQVAELIEAAEKAAAAGTVKVRVVGNYRVIHEAKPFVGGEVLELPHVTAAKWVRNGWVEIVTKGSK
jgi:hypothetical protein